MAYEVSDEVPTPEEYCKLRIDAGLSEKSIKAARIGLKNSLFTVSVRERGVLIGIGRVIGDGACFFQIVDMAVAPEYQGQGLGNMIMLRLEQYLVSVAQEGSYVSLIGDKPSFYEKLGYLHTAPDGYGMYKKF